MFTSLLLFSLGCTTTVQPPPGSTVSISDDVSIGWNSELNAWDLTGMILLIDVAVADPNGTAMQNAEVEVTSNYGGVYLVPQSAIELVAYPGLPADIQSTADVKAACTDEGGNYVLAEDWCAWYWDSGSGQFYQFSGTYADALSTGDSGTYWYAPTYVQGTTDERGIYRVYALIDTMPTTETGYSEAQITASIQVSSESMSITPSD